MALSDKIPLNLRHEFLLRQEGYIKIAGVDEAGCGPLAGPVVAAAVILPEEFYDVEIIDSKKIISNKRQSVYERIIATAVDFSIGIVHHQEIDKINIRQASLKAMRQALGKLKILPDYVLFDGYEPPERIYKQRVVINGDEQCFTISAASIIAKVSRDQIMMDYHRQFPYYGFDRHKGYGTAYHREMLIKHGPCPIHRRTFLSKIIPDF